MNNLNTSISNSSMVFVKRQEITEIRLPKEIIMEIFSHLFSSFNLHNMNVCSLVSKDWNLNVQDIKKSYVYAWDDEKMAWKMSKKSLAQSKPLPLLSNKIF